MAVLHNHIRSTHSIKVGNGLRAEVKGSAAAGALFPHPFIGVSPEIKNKKMLIKKILAVESLGMVHPEWQSAKPGFGGGGLASLGGLKGWALAPAAVPSPLAAGSAWPSASPSPGSFALLLFPRLPRGCFLLAFLFSLWTSEIVNLIPRPRLCFSFLPIS